MFDLIWYSSFVCFMSLGDFFLGFDLRYCICSVLCCKIDWLCGLELLFCWVQVLLLRCLHLMRYRRPRQLVVGMAASMGVKRLGCSWNLRPVDALRCFGSVHVGTSRPNSTLLTHIAPSVTSIVHVRASWCLIDCLGIDHINSAGYNSASTTQSSSRSVLGYICTYRCILIFLFSLLRAFLWSYRAFSFEILGVAAPFRGRCGFAFFVWWFPRAIGFQCCSVLPFSGLDFCHQRVLWGHVDL